jgi:predicted hotdog family 3-hydroxylacyl-ACP dehydratase
MIDITQDITKFIPQRPPFVLVDKLRLCNEEETNSSFQVPESHIMVKDNKLNAGGLVENMAQTAAAGTGYLGLLNNEEVKRGYIGAIKNLNIYKLPEVGTILFTRTMSVNKVLNVNIIRGDIHDKEGFKYAECEMKIFLEE